MVGNHSVFEAWFTQWSFDLNYKKGTIAVGIGGHYMNINLIIYKVD
jgi:hypothetical protein